MRVRNLRKIRFTEVGVTTLAGGKSLYFPSAQSIDDEPKNKTNKQDDPGAHDPLHPPPSEVPGHELVKRLGGWLRLPLLVTVCPGEPFGPVAGRTLFVCSAVSVVEVFGGLPLLGEQASWTCSSSSSTTAGLSRSTVIVSRQPP